MMENTGSVRPSVCFEVQKIIGVSIGSGGNLSNYQVLWAPTWVSGFHLVGCEHLIEQFLQQQSAKNQFTSTTGVTDTAVLQNDFREDIMQNDDVFESTSRQHSRVDTHEQASVGINNEHCFENQESNTCLYSNTSKDNVNIKVEINMETNECTNDKDASSQTNTTLESVKVEVVDDNEYTKEDNAMLLHHSSCNNNTTAANIQDFEWIETEDVNSNKNADCDNAVPSSLVCKDAYVDNDYVNSYEEDNGTLLAGGSTHGKHHLVSSGNEFQNNVFEVQRGDITLEAESGQNSLNNDYENSGISIEHVSSYAGDYLKRERLYKCTFCDKSFIQKNVLTNHITTHTKEKPYQCADCHQAFSRKQYLTLHIRTHTGIKPYNCMNCDKSFSQKSSLNRHSRLHTRV